MAGFVQPIVNSDGSIGSISPFRIPPFVPDPDGRKILLYPADVASVNHSHVALARKLALAINPSAIWLAA